MTDNEIIKALECISGKVIFCKNCAYNKSDGSSYAYMERAAKDALDLINRYQAENERLKEKSITDDKLLNDRVQEAVNAVSKANQKYVDALEKAFNDRTAELKTAKAEAIKEFADKVIDLVYEADDIYSINEWQIRDLVKEMVGDTDA